jgi:HEPN domain-containing protein
MKRATREWLRKAEDDYLAARKLAKGGDPLPDQVCFHCQQSAEKLLKAILEEQAALRWAEKVRIDCRTLLGAGPNPRRKTHK